MKKSLGVLCAIPLLAACGTPGMLGKTDANVTAAQDDAVRALQANAAPTVGAIEHVPGAWLVRKSVAIDATQALPSVFARNVRFSTGAPLPMSVVLQQVARGNGVTIRIGADVACGGGGSTSSSSPRGGSSGSSARAGAFNVPCTDAGEPAVPLQYSGTLGGLLDTIALRTGTSWAYRDGAIVFSRFVTRTFQIKMMPGRSTYTASVGKSASMQAQRGASGGGSSSGGGVDLNFNADAKFSTELKLDYWSDVVETVSDMLSLDGRVTPSTVTSSLVVTDTAQVLERVARFVDAQNAVLGRQVKLRVQVYNVSLTEQSAAGIDWKLVYTMSSGLVLGAAGNALSGTAAALKGGFGMNNVLPRGRLAGSQAFLKALSKQGRVSTVIDTTVVTLNNQPAPVAVTDNQGFIAQTTMTAGGLTSQPVVTAEQSMLTTGFVMTMVPTLMDNLSVMLQVQIDMSDLKRLQKINLATGASSDEQDDDDGDDGDATSVDVEAGGVKASVGGKGQRRKRASAGLGSGTYMQLPETSSVQTMQRASLKSGDTLVLSGFRRKMDKTDRDGIFAYEGGTKEADQSLHEVVILISPELTEGV